MEKPLKNKVTIKDYSKEELDNNVLDETEILVLLEFVKHGGRERCFRKYIDFPCTTGFIFKWFSSKPVTKWLSDYTNSLSVYDTIADTKLISIMTASQTKDNDKISAIKTWNELRKRITNKIEVVTDSNIDFSNLDDAAVTKLAELILNKNKEDE